MNTVLGMAAVLVLSACQSAPPPPPPRQQHVRPSAAQGQRCVKCDRAKRDEQLRLLQQDLRKLQFRTFPFIGDIE